MKTYAKYLSMLGFLSLIGCGTDTIAPTGPVKDTTSTNPFKGKWRYIKEIGYANDGVDTVDNSELAKNDFMVYYDSTGVFSSPLRARNAGDSIHYRFNNDSLFETNGAGNFLHYIGRPYEFKGKDTLIFSDPFYLEVLVRTK